MKDAWRTDAAVIREAAAQALVRLGASAAPAAAALAREVLKAPETDIRYFAAQALGNVRSASRC